MQTEYKNNTAGYFWHSQQSVYEIYVVSQHWTQRASVAPNDLKFEQIRLRQVDLFGFFTAENSSGRILLGNWRLIFQIFSSRKILPHLILHCRQLVWHDISPKETVVFLLQLILIFWSCLCFPNRYSTETIHRRVPHGCNSYRKQCPFQIHEPSKPHRYQDPDIILRYWPS